MMMYQQQEAFKVINYLVPELKEVQVEELEVVEDVVVEDMVIDQKIQVKLLVTMFPANPVHIPKDRHENTKDIIKNIDIIPDANLLVARVIVLVPVLNQNLVPNQAHLNTDLVLNQVQVHPDINLVQNPVPLPVHVLVI
jgi:hypothetical protein